MKTAPARRWTCSSKVTLSSSKGGARWHGNFSSEPRQGAHPFSRTPFAELRVAARVRPATFGWSLGSIVRASTALSVTSESARISDRARARRWTCSSKVTLSSSKGGARWHGNFSSEPRHSRAVVLSEAEARLPPR
jgi:hypothetical protein